MHFTPYPSIEYRHRKKFLERVCESGYHTDTYIVQEKIHGANVSFRTDDGQTIQFAKRTAFLGDDEKFYNRSVMLDRYRDKISALRSILQPTDTLAVYGEMFGGNYPGLQCELPMIQKGVYYSPKHEFICFDIKVDGRYLGVEEYTQACQQIDLLFSKTLFTGSLEDCFSHPDQFPSQLGIDLGYPALPDNLCEGIVIRPVTVRYIGYDRVIFKSKNQRFAEKTSQKKHAKKPFIPLSEQALAIQDTLLSYNTPARLHAVVSKTGPVSDPKQLGKIVGPMTADIFTDYAKDCQDDDLPNGFDALGESEQKRIKQYLGKLIVRLIYDEVMDAPDRENRK